MGKYSDFGLSEIYLFELCTYIPLSNVKLCIMSSVEQNQQTSFLLIRLRNFISYSQQDHNDEQVADNEDDL